MLSLLSDVVSARSSSGHTHLHSIRGSKKGAKSTAALADGAAPRLALSDLGAEVLEHILSRLGDADSTLVRSR